MAVPALLMAGTEEIVGTWLRPDRSTVEFRTDGNVATEAGSIGKWERLRDSPKYVLRFAGTRDFYYVTVGGYKRLLTMELQSRGTRTTLERIDNGNTQNFDVPDEKTALQTENIDIKAEMDRISADLPIVRREAAQLWARYEESRSLGRATGINMQAQQKDSQVRGMEHRLAELRKRMATINLKLSSIK